MYKMWKTRTLKPYILTNSSSAFRKIIPSLYLRRKRHGHIGGTLMRPTCEIVPFDPQRRTNPVLTLDCESNFPFTKADKSSIGAFTSTRNWQYWHQRLSYMETNKSTTKCDL